MFQDGVCVSSTDPLDADRMELRPGAHTGARDAPRYYVFIGSNGPCEVSVNVGGKIFRSHHDEVNRGLIDIQQNQLITRTQLIHPPHLGFNLPTGGGHE